MFSVNFIPNPTFIYRLDEEIDGRFNELRRYTLMNGLMS
jgi:hypothetical protein